MSDQAKSVDDLLELLADDRYSGVAAKDLRSLLRAALGGSAWLSIFDGSTAQSFSGTTGEMMTGWGAGGSSLAMVADVDGNRLVARIAGKFRGGFACSMEGTGLPLTQFRVRVNGVEQGFGFNRKLGSTDVGAGGFMIPELNLNVGDEVAVYLEVDNSSDTITPVDAQFYMVLSG